MAKSVGDKAAATDQPLDDNLQNRPLCVPFVLCPGFEVLKLQHVLCLRAKSDGADFHKKLVRSPSSFLFLVL